MSGDYLKKAKQTKALKSTNLILYTIKQLGVNMDFSKITEWLKVFSKYPLPISLVTGFVLFANEQTLESLGLLELVSLYKSYLSIIFLLSSALLLTNWMILFFQFLQKRYKLLRSKKSEEKYLHSLTQKEKIILLLFIHFKTKDQNLPITDGTVSGLEGRRVIIRAPSIGNPENWAYIIQPWAWDYLNKHRELIDFDGYEEIVETLKNRRMF